MASTRVFLDTSVFIRILTQDDARKFQECVKLWDDIKHGILRPYSSNVVFLEIFFVLTKRYHFPRAKVTKDLQNLLKLRNFTLIEKTNTHQALKYLKKYNIKYGDCLIATQIPRGTMLVTYDTDFKKIPSLLVAAPKELLND